MKIGLLSLCLICFSLMLHAQNLKISELISMRRSGSAQIDSIMEGKGFSKKVVQQNSDYSIVTYTYTGVESGSSVQRSLQNQEGANHTLYIFSVNNADFK